MASQALTRVSGRYPLLALGAVTVALIGYLGYVFYPRFDVPAGSGAGLFLLAIGSGIASFFSPCSFPLLVSILARSPVGDRGRFRSVLTFAGALSLGATAFLLLFGLLIALGAGTLFEDVTFTSAAGRAIRITVGALLVLLGLVQLNRLPISFRGFEPAMHGFLRRQATLRRRRPLLGFTLFGFGYLLAGFGWTGPILVGLTGQALTVGGFGAALVAFAVAGLMIVVLMFTLAASIGAAQEKTVESMRAAAPAVKRWGGRILIVVGVWFVALGVFADFFAEVFPV